MAREYLARQYDALQIGFQLNRLRDAADRLVRTPWARGRLERIAAALLDRGMLTSEDIAALDIEEPLASRRRCALTSRSRRRTGFPTYYAPDEPNLI